MQYASTVQAHMKNGKASLNVAQSMHDNDADAATSMIYLKISELVLLRFFLFFFKKTF